MKNIFGKYGSCQPLEVRLPRGAPRTPCAAVTTIFQNIVFIFILVITYTPSINATSLDNIETTYQKTKTLQMEFIQNTYVPLLEETVSRPGRIFYEKGKLRIEYAGDKMTHYISDGQTLWIVDPQTKQMQTISAKESGLPSEALRFLTELGNLRQYFKVQTKKTDTFVFKPKKRSTYQSLTCTFDESHYLKELTIQTHAGNTSQYRFFNRKENVPLSKHLFHP